MISSTEKAIIISGSMFGSVYLFSISLYCLNENLLRKNNFNRVTYDDNHINQLILLNGLTMLFSAGSFGYFTYIATK